jgi:fucose 4-O-acetylase-like acetyltransferase
MRLTGYDVVKGAAILMVVFGHVWRGLEGGVITDAAMFRAVDQAVYLFHMPVFFFLSGLFLTTGAAFVPYLRSRLALLIWPLILWTWIDAALRQGLGRNEIGGLWDIFTAPFPPKGVYWFLMALFLLHILAWLLAQLPIAIRIGAIMTLSLLAALGRIDVAPFDVLWPTVIHMPEFLIGYAMGTMGLRSWPLRKELLLPGILLFITAQALLMVSNYELGLWHEVAVALAMLGFVLALANRGMPRRLAAGLEALGRVTMPIYLTHVIFTAATRSLLEAAGILNLSAHIGFGVLAGVVGPLALLATARMTGLAGLCGFEGGAVTGKPSPMRQNG